MDNKAGGSAQHAAPEDAVGLATAQAGDAHNTEGQHIIQQGWQSILLDYVLAFTLLGLAGAIAKPFKNRLVGVAVGTAAVCGIRFLCSFLSGVLIWGNLSDGLPAWTYSLTYNGSYMLPETILTTVAAVLIYKAAPQLFAAQEQ